MVTIGLPNISIPHNNIVQFMHAIIIINMWLYIMLLFRTLFHYSDSYFSRIFLVSLPIGKIVDKIDIRIYILGLTILFSIMSIYLLRTFPTLIVELKDIEGIPSYTKLLDYYTPTLLPLFWYSLSMLISALWVFNVLFFFIGIIFILIGTTVFILLTFLVNSHEFDTYYTLNRANNIFNDYIIKNEKNLFIIYQFKNYFKKSLNNIDIQLIRGVKIDNLIIDGNKSVEDCKSIKNTIIHYLPIYIYFGNQDQINSFKNHIDEMLKLVDKKGTISLEITKVILNIYKDIESFLELHNYSTTLPNRWIELSSLIKTNSIIEIISKTIKNLLYIIGVVVSIVSLLSLNY